MDAQSIGISSTHWTCKACSVSSPKEKFGAIGSQIGLLCPNCCVRFAMSVDTIDKILCPSCNAWSPMKDFRTVYFNRRGDCASYCPVCNVDIETFKE